MKVHDVAIIGAGITGAALARELSRYRLSLLLLEKEAEPAFGVSKSNSGIVHAGTQNPPGTLKARLCVEGNRLISGPLSEELGLDFIRCGQLIAAFGPGDLPRLETIKAEGEAMGVEGLAIVDRAWLDANEPNLSREVTAALHCPTAGMISPYRFVHALVENAVGNGVLLRTLAPVASISRGADRVFSLTAGGENHKARFVVNAAGLYADDVAALAGLPPYPIRPRKGEEYLLDRKREHIANRIIFPLPSGKSKGILVIKTSDGNPMIGPTAHDTADREDLSTTDEGLDEVLEGARRLMPSVNKSDIIAYFAGLRPAAGDDFVVRHEEMVPGFFSAAGIQSPGLTAAPAIALMLKGLLAERGLRLEPKGDFRPLRERTVHLFKVPLPRTRELIEEDPAYGDIVCRCELVSAREVRDAIKRGARTLDGVKFRTRAQAGRCHGGFCTTRLMKIMQEELGLSAAEITKRGPGSEIIKDERK
ncbi:MAG TPA: NAD(P)/FAD-dependent oxidoreductase [Elusimicrobiales bacterium]|nr:NAD(P)/FAD-dependent oxidoreductase [Elusimicrobiales bacterium]